MVEHSSFYSYAKVELLDLLASSATAWFRSMMSIQISVVL